MAGFGPRENVEIVGRSLTVMFTVTLCPR